MVPLNAINPLDSFNKGLKKMFYVQKKSRSTTYMQLLRRNPYVMTNINVLVLWHKWTFNEINKENPRKQWNMLS